MFKFAVGLFLGLSMSAGVALAVDSVELDDCGTYYDEKNGYMAVRVPTNDFLNGYIVQKDGKEVCRDPGVWNEFRGPDSYIVCTEE